MNKVYCIRNFHRIKKTFTGAQCNIFFEKGKSYEVVSFRQRGNDFLITVQAENGREEFLEDNIYLVDIKELRKKKLKEIKTKYEHESNTQK